IFVEIIARLGKNQDLSDAIEIASKLPRELNDEPFAGLMWDTSTRTIQNNHKVTLREVLCHLVGCSKYTEKTLIERYSRALGQEDVNLPERVI
ncbi:MAG: hypothetical protein AAGL24_24870, partial [Pseudomonadota bacterium]